MELYKSEKECCACGACVNVCTKNAILMKQNEIGFKYPVINNELCINCGKCKTVCRFQNDVNSMLPIDCYAAMAVEEKSLLASASGGAATIIAKCIIENGGVVFGAALECKDGQLMPHHIMIDRIDELYKIQGSKYVQSEIVGIYKEVKDQLKRGSKVLFVGTPCQVNGIKAFLNKYETENLYTIDIICHGVPSAKMFQDYIKVIEHKKKAQIVDFKFRDKTTGWGLNASYTLKKDAKLKKVYLPSSISSYYTFFLESEIYRDSCYSCVYASEKRVGDITLGDYWGIEKEHPEYMKNNGGSLDEKKGISCIIVNSEKGKELLKLAEGELILEKTKFEKIKKWNGQLNHPSESKKAQRSKLLKIYKTHGYIGIEKYFKNKTGIKYPIRILKNTIRRKVKI